MDLDNAINAHTQWKVKFRTAIGEKLTLDAVNIGRDNCCELGTWLHGEGRARLGTQPAFRTLVDRHRDFHVEAGKVARTINAGQYDAANAMLGSGTPFATASSAVASAVIGLKRVA